MSRKHIKLTTKMTVSMIILVVGSSYATKVLLESKYSKMNAKQQTEFKMQFNKLQDELQLRLETIDSNSEDMTNMKKQINELQEDLKKKENDLKEKDKIIKSISLNFGAKFDPNDLSAPSGATKLTMQKILKGKAMEGYAGVFVEAERRFHINAIGLASIVAQESGWGTSNAAINLNNMSGTYINGELHYFSSKQESIMFTAENIAKNYLDPKGKYYSGKSIEDINARYCLKSDGKTPMYSWSTNVVSISRGMVSKAKSH